MSKFLNRLLKERKSPKEVLALLLAVAIFLSAFVSMPLSFFAFADDSVPYVRVNPGAYSAVHYVSPGTDATAMVNKGYYKITFSVKMLTGNPTFSIQANTGSGYKDIKEYCYSTTTYPFLREEYYDENGISKLSYSFRTNAKITDYKIIFGSYDTDDNTNSTIIVAKPEMHRYTNKSYNVLHTSDPGNMLPEFSTDSIYYPMEQTNTSNAEGKWNFRYLTGKASTVIFGTMTADEYKSAFSRPTYMLHFYKGGVNDYVEYVDNTVNLTAGDYTFSYKYKDFGTEPALSLSYSTDGGSTYTEKSHLDSTGDGAGNYTLAFTLTEAVNAIKIKVGNPTDNADNSLAFAEPMLTKAGDTDQLLEPINEETINETGSSINKKWNIYADADNAQAIDKTNAASVSGDYFKPDTAKKIIYENVSGKSWTRLFYTDYACKVSAGKNYIVTADFKLNAGDMSNSLIGSGDDPAFKVKLGDNTLSLANADKFNGIVPEFDELNGKITIKFSPKTDMTGANIIIGSYAENSVGSCAVANFSLCEFITKTDGTVIYKDSLVSDITDQSTNIGNGKGGSAVNGKWNTIYLASQSEHIISDYSKDYFKPTPGMIEIKDNAAGAYISYVDDTTVLSAGSKYRLQYNLKTLSGTPETSFAAKQIGGVDGAGYSEISDSADFISYYNEEFDNTTFQKTITFIPNKNISKLQLFFGNITPSNASSIIFAKASLYKLEDDVATGDNLLTSIARPTVARNSSTQKCWNLVATDDSYITFTMPVKRGVFSGEKAMKIITGSNYNRTVYYDNAFKFLPNTKYRFSANYVVNSGSPVFSIAYRDNSSGVNYVNVKNISSTFSDTYDTSDTSISKRVIEFTTNATLPEMHELRIMVGNAYEATDVDALFANPEMYILDDSGNPTGQNLLTPITEETVQYMGDYDYSGIWNLRYNKSGAIKLIDFAKSDFVPAKGMIEINDNAAGVYTSYLDDTTVLSAGNKYQFQYRMRANSGTPEFSFAAKQIGDAQGDYTEIDGTADFISSFDEVYEEDTFTKTITFTTNTDISKLRIVAGNTTLANDSSMALSAVSLYRLDDTGNIASDNLITDISLVSVLKSTAMQKRWNLVSANDDIKVVAPVTRGKFAVEKMVKISTGDTYNRARYLDGNFTFLSGKSYMFTADYVVNSGSPTFSISNVKAKSSSYEVIDNIDDAKKTIKFTIAEGKTVSGLDITIGNNGESKSVSLVFANPELYVLDDSGNPTGENLVNPVTEETSKLMGDWESGGIWNLRHADSKVKSIELIDMDETYFRSLSTLVIEDANGNITQTVTVKPSTYYRLSYLVKNSGTSKVSPYIKAILPGGTAEDVACSESKEDADGYYSFSCEFQTPATLQSTDNLRVGIEFDNAVSASVTNIELYEYNKGFEPTGVSLIADGDFSALVSIPAYISTSDTAWTYEGTIGTTTTRYRSPNMFKILIPQMFIFVGGSNGNYIGQTATLQKGHAYNLSFNLRYANPGFEGETGVDLLYCATVQDTDEGGNLLFNDDSTPKMVDKWLTLPATDNSPANEYKKSYNFTLPDDASAESNMQFRVKIGSVYVSGYMADAKLVDTSDTSVNILENGDFKKGTMGWTTNGSIKRTYLTEIPDGYFTNPQSNTPHMLYYRDASSWENFAQSYLNLKSGAYYKLIAKSVHPWELIDTSVYSIQVFAKDEDGKDIDPFIGTVSSTIENNTYTRIYQMPENLKSNGNTYFRIVMQGGGNSGYWGEMALYECDKDGNISSDNVLINGDFSLGLAGWEISPTDNFVYRNVEQPANFFETYQKSDDNMIVSEGTAENATVGQTVAVQRGKDYYFTGFYVNNNLAGITPKVMYYNTSGEYVAAPVEFMYDSNRFYFEGKFTLPDDAKSLRGKTTVDFLLTNGAGGKAYISTLGVYEEGKYINLLQNSDFKNGFTGWNVSGANYIIAPYDESVFVFHYDDKSFDDGDWSGTTTMSLAGNGEIVGRIVDGDGYAKKGIKVVLKPGNITVTTDEEGMYKFTNIKPGDYSLYIVTPVGEEVFIKEVSVESGMQHYVSDITLALLEDDSLDSAEFDTDYNYGVVCGYLFDSDGNPLKGQKLYLGKVGSVTTKKKGVFQFNDVPPGKYDIFTELEDGSVHIFRRVEVTAGKGSIYKLRMPGGSGLGIWWIVLIAVGGALVLAGGTVLVILLIKKKKKAIIV